MSYILDALVKADLERQQRNVPGLNTVQAPPVPRGAAVRERLFWIGTVALAAVLSLAWDRLGRGPAPAPILLAREAPASAPAMPAAKPPTVVPEAAPARPAPAPAAPIRREAPPEAGLKMAPEIRNKPESRLYAIAELPPALQEQARKISVTGFAQAGGAEERLAIINDRALREGDEVTTGLRVERIANDGVVFNLRGFRFRKGSA